MTTPLAEVLEFMRASQVERTAESEAEVKDLIYRVCHGRQPMSRPGVVTWSDDDGDARDFVAKLSEANCGVGPEHQWTVRMVEPDGRLAVERDGLMLWVDPQPGRSAGDVVSVRFPKEYRNLYPGHYVVLGDADRADYRGAIRIYWHIRAEGARQLVQSVSREFNRSAVPFRLKVLSAPGGYRRADAGILYIAPSHLGEARTLIRDVYFEVRGQMRPDVSTFVLPLAPGLGLAEDPPDGSSFGIHRSTLIAALLFDALGHAEPLATVAVALKSAGYPLDRMYLNPGSVELYRDWQVHGD